MLEFLSPLLPNRKSLNSKRGIRYGEIETHWSNDVIRNLTTAQADEQLDAVARIFFLAYCQIDLHNRASSSHPKLGIHRKKGIPL